MKVDSNVKAGLLILGITLGASSIPGLLTLGPLAIGLQPVSYDFALISESYSTNKHRRVYYDNSPPSSSSISSRQ